MGGMIAQTIALRHPSRVLSLTSIYSQTGNPKLPQPKPEVLTALLTPIPTERAAYIEYMLGFFKMVTGHGYPLDEEWTIRNMAASYDRCFYPHGIGRQVIAIMAQNNRKAALASIKIPVLVIHGTDDPLVPVEGGKETAIANTGRSTDINRGDGA